MSPRSGRAVVIGASVAGALAAAALRGSFEEVLVLERDRLPWEPIPRCGVPQARHSHLLSAAGCHAVEELLPGALAHLLRAGAVTGAMFQPDSVAGSTAEIAVDQEWMLSVRREQLEAVLRDRVVDADTVELRPRTSVLGLATDSTRAVGGVLATKLDGPNRGGRTIDCDLVVDASGRGSRLSQWLDDLRLPRPEVERRRVDARFVSRTFCGSGGGRALAQWTDDPTGVGLSATDPAESWAIQISRVGRTEWIATLAGYGGQVPPADPTSFVANARDIHPCAGRLLASLRPVGDAARYRVPALYERRGTSLWRGPNRVRAIGDAGVNADPLGPAGMAAAALDALALRVSLRSDDRSDG